MSEPKVFKKLNRLSPLAIAEKLDLFSSPLPTFNLSGKPAITTYTGGFLSIGIIIVMMSYAYLKLDQLMAKHNPNISTLNEQAVYDSSEVLDFTEINFRVAFSMVSFFGRETKDDPRYVKYFARHFGKVDGVWYEEMLPIHKCTEEDWALFDPPSRLSTDSIQSIWDNPDTRYMYCFEPDAKLQTWGGENNETY